MKQQITNYIVNQDQLDLDYKLNWTKSFIRGEQKITEQKSTSSKETIVPYMRMNFVKIKKLANLSQSTTMKGQFVKAVGAFKEYFKKDCVYSYQEKNPDLDYSIEIMSTLVTQSMWVNVTGVNIFPQANEKYRTYGQFNDEKKTIHCGRTIQ